MTLALKDYQKRALGTEDMIGALSSFFEAARGADSHAALQQAFDHARRSSMGKTVSLLPYRPLAKAGEEGHIIPQVCLRIPTGGGKTLLAAHAIERAAKLYIGTRYPVVLWLTPTNTIRSQTLDALQTPGHPYREALLAHWPADKLRVIDITDGELLGADDLGKKAVVVVGTRQTLQVENTASRDIYAYKEAFEPHFANLPAADFFERISEADLAANASMRRLLGKAAIGRIKRSFANLLAWHRPIVIMDEAHNARGELAYEVFRRIRPACVIEWTATPQKDQNVLFHVSAQALKAEHMIKLPIVLSPHPNWQEAVRDALATRERLAALAVAEPDYIRPIVLLQADAINGEVPVDKLKQHLMTQYGIDERRIAVATGKERGLDGVNLFDRACPLDFVITVEALKEGWDCSFAYVFCTVQNIRSAKDMEQLLGRVLRLPYARERKHEALNRAYAHVCGPNTAAVADQLADRLVSMGFEELAAAQFIQPDNHDLFAEDGVQKREMPPLPVSEITVPAVTAELLQSLLPKQVKTVATSVTPAVAANPGEATPAPADTVTLTLQGALPATVVEQVLNSTPKKERAELDKQLTRHQARTLAAQSPSQRGEAFGALPQLVVPVQGELMLMEGCLLAELADFSLANAPADLPDFSQHSEDKAFLIDIERGKTRITTGDGQTALDLNAGEQIMPRAVLIRELGLRVRHSQLTHADVVAWLGRAIDGLLQRGIPFNYLVRHINKLATAMAQRIQRYLAREQKQRFDQCLLLDSPSGVRLDAHHSFRYSPHQYPANWFFPGRYDFKKHYYPLPGELDGDLNQAETACAIEIDSLPDVRYWVRNLALKPMHSFWLPTSTDRFYPDFVAELNDGRLLAVEYKGEDRESNDDSQEKRDIGEAWAQASGRRCVFVMVTHAKKAGMSVGAQLRQAISSH